MLEVIKTAAILHKCINCDAALLPAIEILKMATSDGAKVVGRENEIGSIETGKKADFFLFQSQEHRLCAISDPVASLVILPTDRHRYSSHPWQGYYGEG